MLKVLILRGDRASEETLISACKKTMCQIRKLQVRGLRRLKQWEFAFRK